jgi:formate dehydrogenase gamma subunit
MNLSQRIQHFVLAASFILLAITGFALKFPDSWIAKVLGSNEGFRRWSHRGAGVVLLLVGAYHVLYILTKKDGRQLVKDLLPVTKDLRDVADNARYLTGLSSNKAKIGRFGYAEKMEYWAVIWGTLIMGVTGLMIWFKMDVTQLVPRWAVDVALTIHYYEAILACLAIVVWHFYHVIFDPDVYPLNWACWKGKVSRHWQEEEHPLDRSALEENGKSSSSQPNGAEDLEITTHR